MHFSTKYTTDSKIRVKEEALVSSYLLYYLLIDIFIITK